LHNYRITPHATTGVAPAVLLFKRPVRNKLPQANHADPVAEIIRKCDYPQNSKIKAHADSKTYVKPCTIPPGETVLVKRPFSVSKGRSVYDPTPMTILSLRVVVPALQLTKGAYKSRRLWPQVWMLLNLCGRRLWQFPMTKLTCRAQAVLWNSCFLSRESATIAQIYQEVNPPENSGLMVWVQARTVHHNGVTVKLKVFAFGLNICFCLTLISDERLRPVNSHRVNLICLRAVYFNHCFIHCIEIF